MATRGAGLDLLRSESVIIDYTSLDRDALFIDFKRYVQTTYSDRWSNFNDSEWAIIFLSVQAYFGDLLTLNLNAQLGEVNPLTAQLRSSFIDGAKPFDFTLSSATPSSVDVTVTSDPAEIPYLIEADAYKASTPGNIIFMPTSDFLVTTTPQNVPFVEGDISLNEVIGVSNSTSLQKFILGNSPLIDKNPDGTATLTVFVGAAQWASSPTPADAQGTSEVYFISTDDQNITTITFGDNINGKIPGSGEAITATYKFGGGVQGSNASAGTITVQVVPLPGITAITNLVGAAGGSPRQSLQAGKTALPAQVSTNRRCINAQDYADILFTNFPGLAPPVGVAKASAIEGQSREVLSFISPSGGGLPSTTLKSAVAEFYNEVKEVGRTVSLRLDPTYIDLEITIDAFIDPNFRGTDVVDRLRALLVTESVNPPIQGGIFDFDNVGFEARDDAGNPQITETRLQGIFTDLGDGGLQKGVITRMTITPQTKKPFNTVNAGNGGLTSLISPLTVSTPRRQWVARFTSATTFNVFSRVIGFSTFLSDDTLVDDRLNLEGLGFTASLGQILPTGTVLNPDFRQDLTFDVGPLSTGDTIQSVSAAGSLYGTALTGSKYFLEWQDGSGTTGVNYVSTANLLGEVEFLIDVGTTSFTSGDEILFDVFPLTGDILLSVDEIPQFARDVDGAATRLIINERTAL